MTFRKTTSKSRVLLPSPGQVLFGFMCALSLILILRNSEAAIDSIGRGLQMCVRTVIPSLFPFMVLSELIISSGLGEFFGRLLDRPLGRLFGISGVSATAVLLGTLCGFPIGARTTVALLDKGSIDRREASRLLTFCNNPSSAFIISAVGSSLYSNRRLGLVLYTITIVNAAVIGIVQGLFVARKEIVRPHSTIKRPSGIDAFTSSVTNSAQGMLIVCAYVVFFSAILGCMSGLLSAFGATPEWTAFIYGILEISGGVAASAALGPELLFVCLSSFIIGWSGLSVHFQIISVCSGRGLSFRGYFFAKLIQGLMNAAATFSVCSIFPALLEPAVHDTLPVSLPLLDAFKTTWSAIVVFVFSVFIPAGLKNLFSVRVPDRHK